MQHFFLKQNKKKLQHDYKYSLKKIFHCEIDTQGRIEVPRCWHLGLSEMFYGILPGLHLLLKDESGVL